MCKYFCKTIEFIAIIEFYNDIKLFNLPTCKPISILPVQIFCWKGLNQISVRSGEIMRLQITMGMSMDAGIKLLMNNFVLTNLLVRGR